jgi:RNA polymerase sigma-70 factor (ECF subfamily)
VAQAQLASLPSSVGVLGDAVPQTTYLGQVDAAEALLVARCQSGDPEAWRVFVERFQEQLYNTAYGYVQNRTEADDLAQEAFLAVYRALPSFRGEARLQTWLYRITVNVCLQAIRRRRPPTAELPDEYEEGAARAHSPSWQAGPEDLSLRREARLRVRQMVAQLPAKFREVVVLCDLQDLPYEETAAILRISIGTVRSRLHRGRNRLKEMLKDYFHELESAA